MFEIRQTRGKPQGGVIRILDNLTIKSYLEYIIFFYILLQDTTRSDEDAFSMPHTDSSSCSCHPAILVELFAEGDHGAPGGIHHIIFLDVAYFFHFLIEVGQSYKFL